MVAIGRFLFAAGTCGNTFFGILSMEVPQQGNHLMASKNTPRADGRVRKEKSKIAAAVLVLSPDGVCFVLEESRDDPLFWKLPGGRARAPRETPAMLAARELREESGIQVSPDAFTVLYRGPRRGHMFYLFGVWVSDVTRSGLKPFGPVTGERTRIVPLNELDAFITSGEVLPTYKRLLTFPDVLDNIARMLREQ